MSEFGNQPNMPIGISEGENECNSAIRKEIGVLKIVACLGQIFYRPNLKKQERAFVIFGALCAEGGPSSKIPS